MPMHLRSLLVLPLAIALLAHPVAASTATPAVAGLDAVLDRAADIAPLETVIVAVGGERVAERGYRGHRVTAATNIKSASKSVIALLIGIAIDRGLLEGPDQPIAPLLARDLPRDPDPRLARVTIGNLLSMQAGLERTSGPNYGRWVASPNWVRAALDQPFVDEPGGDMLYSTGSTHLLSAILTRVTGRSTLALAREWLAPVDGFAIAAWDRDPQGIYLGGNQMAMSPLSLLAFGEVARTGGLAPDGTRVVSAEWIAASWEPRTASRFTGDGYGYGWFLRDIAGVPVRYAWGYGGQMLYVIPDLGLTIAMTSDETAPSGRTGHRDALHGLAGEIIRQVALDRAAAEEAAPPADAGGTPTVAPAPADRDEDL
jgi:CubicO group peptidase (beta-lactamase class C family)